MAFLRNKLFSTPWRIILFFAPVAALVSLAVYGATLVGYVFPGEVSANTAYAAGLCEAPDLSHPFFRLASRWVAGLPWGPLPARLNFFSALCSAAAAGFFYLLAARLIFGFSVEDPGGATRAFPLLERPGEDPDAERPVFSVDIPLAVQIHNGQTAAASVLGGLCAAAALAFCPPFWIAATRLLPYGFDLMVFFLIIDLMIAYVQGGRDVSLFLGIFLTALFSVESPLFALLFPIAAVILFRFLVLNEEANAFRVLSTLLLCAAGIMLAWAVLWVFSRTLQEPPGGNKALLALFFRTAGGEALRWIPDYGWIHYVLFLILPSALAVGLAPHSFRRRTPAIFLPQLALAALLAPSLFNLDFSLWGADRHIGRLPVFSHALLALYAGALAAAWFLMRESRLLKKELEDRADEDAEPDLYETEDNRTVATIGSRLCWPLAAAIAAAPFLSFVDVDPGAGAFADKLVEAIASRLRPGDCLVNPRGLRYPLLLNGYMHGKPLHAVAASSRFLDDTVSPALAAWIREDPAFDGSRTKLLNHADISTAGFLREWVKCDTNAHRRLALFADTALLDKSGYAPLPAGLFMRCAPADALPDPLALYREQLAFIERVRPFLAAGEAGDRDRLFAETRRKSAVQLALIGNELGCLLARKGHLREASGLFREMEAFDPDNLSLLFNQYQLAVFNGAGAGRLPEIEKKLKALPGRIDTFSLSGEGVRQRCGTLIDPDVLAHVRRNVWLKGLSFRALLSAAPARNTNPLSALRDKKNELRHLAAKYLDETDYDSADRVLDILLDMNAKDVFVMKNKARIALLKGDMSEAGVWTDLARENGAKPDDLLWHDAMSLYLAGRKKEAKAFLNDCLPDHSDDVCLWGLLAQILIDEDRFDELESRVYPALRMATAHKDHYLFNWIRGILLERAGNDASARTAFRRAIQLNPHLESIRERLLELDDRIGAPSFSEEDAKAFLRIHPGHPFANYLLGMARLHAKEWALAEDLFRRSLRAGRNPGALAGLGAALLAQGRPDEAEQAIRESLRLEPSRIFTRHQMAKLFLATGRPAEAEKEIEKVLKQQPDSFDARLTQTLVWIRQGRLEEAADRVAPLIDRLDSLPPEQREQVTLLNKQLREKLGI